jgi:tyrosine-protein kinase Etk/Wzc
VSVLRGVVSAGEVKTLGAVRVDVTTKWPSVSLQLTERLVRGVNQFNQQTRKSQASAERQFVEAQAAEAERALRAAEDRLQEFLQRNREVSGSPQLAFERDRLQREVSLRQQVYTSLLQNREEARIREVRDLPVTTMIEEPKLPVVGEPRRTVMRIVLGGIAGALFAVVAAFVNFGLSIARKQPGDDVREFFALVESATPRYLRRRKS